MATETKVISIREAGRAIYQSELENLVLMRQAAERAADVVAALETDIRRYLEAGAEVEPGIFRAFLKMSERRNVAWREIIERELGEGYAAQVLSHTKPTQYVKLVVEA